MIIADIHTHTSFSGDSKEPIENMIKEAIARGYKYYCITEHMDIDYPASDETPADTFLLDTDSYLSKFNELHNKYLEIAKEFTLLFGVELGLQPHLAKTHTDYLQKYSFDYVIGSEHIANRQDPYYPAFFEGRKESEAYLEYFEDILTNLNSFDDIDSLGHLDYVVRYGPNKNTFYSYSKYSDVIDEILRTLIKKGIALEANSGGYKYGLGQPNPSCDILLRYKELGGELLTIGSDAHDITRIGKDFDKLECLLTECGYKGYYIFKNRKPIFIPFA